MPSAVEDLKKLCFSEGLTPCCAHHTHTGEFVRKGKFSSLDYQTAEKLLESVKYKPNFRVHLTREASSDHVTLTICGLVECAYLRNGTKIPIVHRDSLTGESFEHVNEEGLMAWIYNAIRLFEKHEIDEWFMVGNDRPYDPHQPKRGRK